MVNRNRSKKTYKANHSTSYANSPGRALSNYRQKKQEDNEMIKYLKKLTKQALICMCILMGVLVMQRMPNSSTYKGVRGMIMSEIPFSRYNEMYQGFLINLFPFSYRVPAKQPDITAPVVGIENEHGDSYVLEAPSATQLASDIYQNIELDSHGDGIIVRTYQGQEISSFVSGVVIDKGTNENKEIGNFITIQRADDWLITIGLLENIAVSRLEHINVGDTLGVGAVQPDLGDEAYYYIAMQNKEGEYIDIVDYLYQLINEAGE